MNTTIAALFLLNAGLYLDESTHHVVLTLGGALGRKGECAGRYLVY